MTAGGDVTVVAAPGHTRGHVAVVVEEEEQALLFAGDASYSEELMLTGAIDGIALDGRAARETLRRIRELSEQRPVVYLPSHDPDGARRLGSRQAVTAPAAVPRTSTSTRARRSTSRGSRPIRRGSIPPRT